MTEQEFMRQVWRPYDTVVLIGDIHAAVSTVCFPTKSVKVALGNNTYQWFKCADIEKHISRSGNPDDISIIEDLHNKLMAANERNDQLQAIVNNLTAKLDSKPHQEELHKLRKAVNRINDALCSVEARTKQIGEFLTKLEEG